MTTDQKVVMHQEPREATMEIESWFDDICMWQAEHKQALAWLAQIQACIHEHDMILLQHDASVDKQQRHVRQHEHAIAVNEQSGKFKDQSALESEHSTFGEKQLKTRAAHARIGQHHREKIAAVKRLVKEFVGKEQAG
ncbi:MAG: hypothetical protein ACI87E_004807 [Mariniblastus sp.]|jgi:hypothetical protein